MKTIDDSRKLNIVIVGASGDLARRKIFPALFALYCQGYLPDKFSIFGFARSKMDNQSFRDKITEHLTCRYAPGQECAERMDEFLAACSYLSGDYGDVEAFRRLKGEMDSVPSDSQPNCLFYMAVPPSVFLDVANSIGTAGMIYDESTEAWSRVVIEKPFGRDRASSDELTAKLGGVFTEEQIYRIDHYLGKEVVQNLLVLRFANLIFEPIWRREYISRVDISWSEDLDVAGRGGYFDEYGIIRDVMQNHLLQMLALIAMEPPAVLNARDIRDEKVKVLRSIAPIVMNNLVRGQYCAATVDGVEHIGYTEDDSVPSDSSTETYAAVILNIRNARWDGVPFFMRAGKGLAAKSTEISIYFRDVPGNMFCDAAGCPGVNKLKIRIQPDEAVILEINNKAPGLGFELTRQSLDLHYKNVFNEEIPDAYESLLIDVLQGEESLFIRHDELAAAWDIFTPILHAVEESGIKPELYDFGSNGPIAACEMFAEECGIKFDNDELRRERMSHKCDEQKHKGHLCVLASEKKFDELQTLVKDAKFVCFNCGRVAHDEGNLCNPMPLKG